MTQKPLEQEDLRVRRTRKMLQDALIALTVEKGFAAVTVRDITERAMVNRSTFYRHYLDKFDLLEQYSDEVNALTSNAAMLAEKMGGINDKVPSGLLVLLRHVEASADFYRIMLGQNGDAAFTQKFRQNTMNRYRYLLTKITDSDISEIPLEMRLNYVSCAGLGAIIWWLENHHPCSVEQLAIWLGQLNTKSMGLPTQYMQEAK